MRDEKVEAWQRGKSTAVILVVVTSVGLSLLGCSVYQRVIGSPGETPVPTPIATPAGGTAQVFYSGSEALKVYSEPASSSKVVGTLALHEKVSRDKIERGYAHVKSSSRELAGWVNNAALLWRLPAAKAEPGGAPGTPTPELSPAPVEGEPEGPEAPEPAVTDAPPAPEPTLTTAPAALVTPTPRGTTRSLFDPY